MIGRAAYLANLYLAAQCLARPAMAAGSVIECGTWRGGMAAGLATIGGPLRDYHFFDSFAGLPPATDEDGDYAPPRPGEPRREPLFRQQHRVARGVYGRIGQVALPPERLHVHKGFFADTFPGVTVPPIARPSARCRLVQLDNAVPRELLGSADPRRARANR